MVFKCCSALFEPTTRSPDWLRLISNLPGVVPVDPALDALGTSLECGLDVAQLFEKVAADGLLSPITLLLPHFGPKCARKS